MSDSQAGGAKKISDVMRRHIRLSRDPPLELSVVGQDMWLWVRPEILPLSRFSFGFPDALFRTGIKAGPENRDEIFLENSSTLQTASSANSEMEISEMEFRSQGKSST